MERTPQRLPSSEARRVVGRTRRQRLREGSEELHLRQVVQELVENGEIRVGESSLHLLDDDSRLWEAEQAEAGLIVGR